MLQTGGGTQVATPLLVRRDGRMIELEEGGLLVGALPGVPYESGEIKLEDGDLLFMYTDGLTEAMDERETMFGDERLKELLPVLAGAPAREISNSVIASIRSFTGGEAQDDDITIVVLKSTGCR